MTSTVPTLPPVIREVDVAAPLATCFEVFVDGFDSWWPREHHVGGDRDVVEFRIEPEVGGRCYDIERHTGPEGLHRGVSSDGGWTLSLGRFSDVVEGRVPRPLPTPAG